MPFKKDHKLVLLKFLLFMLPVSGYGSVQTVGPAPSVEGKIVIIFKNYPRIDKESKSGVRFYTNIPEVLYWDDEKGTDISPAAAHDTLELTTQSEYILLRHRYDVANYHEFLFRKGDSIVFSYPNGIPTPVLLNRKVTESELSVDKLLKTALVKEQFSPLIKYEWADVFKGSQKVEAYRASLFLQVNALFDKENAIIDSLYENKGISEPVRDFHKHRIYLQAQLLKLKENKLSHEAADAIIREDVDYPFPDRYLNEFTDIYVQKFIFKSVVSKNPLADYAKLLDNPIFSDRQKKRLLTRQTRLIIRSSSKIIYQAHFEKFKTDVNDPALAERVYQEFRDKLSENTGRDMVTIANQNTSLKEILSKSPYTYVDFWASWCKPCLAEIPASKKLRAAFAGKGIQFVYVSIDENAAAWQKAIRQTGLSEADSYLITQGEGSEVYKRFNITSIPRYVILDKAGNLVNGDAPRPSDPAIQKILSALSEKSHK